MTKVKFTLKNFKKLTKAVKKYKKCCKTLNKQIAEYNDKFVKVVK